MKPSTGLQRFNEKLLDEQGANSVGSDSHLQALQTNQMDGAANDVLAHSMNDGWRRDAIMHTPPIAGSVPGDERGDANRFNERGNGQGNPQELLNEKRPENDSLTAANCSGGWVSNPPQENGASVIPDTHFVTAGGLEKGLFGMQTHELRSSQSEPLQPLEARFLSVLAREYGKAHYQAYFNDMTLASVTRDLVAFETASEHHRDIIGRNHLSTIKRLWKMHIGPVDRIAIKLRPEVSRNLSNSSARAQFKEMTPQMSSPLAGSAAKQPFFKDVSGKFSNVANNASGILPASDSGFSTTTFASAAAVSAQALSAQNGEQTNKKPLSFEELLSPVDERNTFETFAVDASNELAYAAAKSAINSSTSPQLIYLHGKSGVGKTHLLHAIAMESRRNNAQSRAAYLPYNNVATGCVSAMLTNNTAALHRAFMSCDIVLLDDVHLLLSKEKTQEQVMAILDACLASGCHVALAGDVGPMRLAEAGMNQRLSDRLAGGLSVAVQSAGPHLRFEVLKKRLSRSDVQCTVTEEALEFIVRNFTHSMRETIGALNQLLLLHSDKPVRIDLALARECLRDRLQDGKRIYSLDELLVVTAEVMGVSVADMQGKARPQPLARARHAFVYCAREVLRESLPRISKALHRDHTTALSSVRRAAALLERDKVFCKQVDQIREKIEC